MENGIRNDTKRKYLNNPSRLYDDSYMVNLLSKIVAEYSSCLFDFTYQHSEKSQSYQLNLAIFFIIYPDLRLEKNEAKRKHKTKKILDNVISCKTIELQVGGLTTENLIIHYLERYVHYFNACQQIFKRKSYLMLFQQTNKKTILNKILIH